MTEKIPYYGARVRREIFDLLPEKSQRILDIGGGTGITVGTLVLEGRAEEGIVFDKMTEAVADGVSHMVHCDLEDHDNIRKLLTQYGPFSAILCLDVLEHVVDPWGLVQILRDSLDESGIIVASVPNVSYVDLVVPLVLFNRFDLRDEGIRDRTHLRWFVKSTAIQLMTPSGLTLESVQDHIVPRKLKILFFFTFGLFKRFFTLQYLIKVRRLDI